MFNGQTVLGETMTEDPFDDPDVVTSIRLTEAEKKLSLPDAEWLEGRTAVNKAPIPQPKKSASPKSKPMSTGVKVGIGLLALGGIYYLWKKRS